MSTIGHRRAFDLVLADDNCAAGPKGAVITPVIGRKEIFEEQWVATIELGNLRHAVACVTISFHGVS
jgi:hypothetical protein